MGGYLPAKDDEFSRWFNNFAQRLMAYRHELDVPWLGVLAVLALGIRFAQEVNGVISAHNAYRAGLAVRDNDRADTIEPKLRKLVQRIQHHPAMTDAIRRDLGIAVPDDKPTPLTAVSIEEVGAPLITADVSQHKRAILRFGPNPLNQRHNALPAGIRRVRLWYYIGNGPPTDEKDWQFLDDDNRSPYTHVTMNAQPMTITYRAAYVDRHNRVGAFSDPVTVTISP